MEKNFINSFDVSILRVCCIVLLLSPIYTSAQNVSLNIHLRGVYQSKISLLSLTENGTFKPVIEINGVTSGTTAPLVVEQQYLPGEFVLRFDYRETQASTPYPSEKSLLIGSQNIELWVNPKYCNNPDSSWFQPGELENTAHTTFAEESFRQKEMIALLQYFLMNYDDTKSKLYKQGIREYEKRRQSYNQWLTVQINEDSELFASRLYSFQFTPPTIWQGTEKERIISMIDHYFDAIDLSDPSVIRTSQITQWIDNYVNLHGKLASSVALRDSIIPEAARKAIEQARQGHPEVYGWMVDYFYRGFEINDIPAGIKALEPYLDDPDCLTSKRKEIEQRLKGMETMTAGTAAPDIELVKTDGSLFSLYSLSPSTPYLLLFFWSAGCIHCKELIETVYRWQQQPEVTPELEVVAVSLDETVQETALWQEFAERYSNWTHLRSPEGVRSKVAADYFILSTPQMILLDAVTKRIIDLPGTPQAITDFIRQDVLTHNN